jgi:hypothetical protein
MFQFVMAGGGRSALLRLIARHSSDRRISTMARRNDAMSGFYDEPPYTKKEQREFRRRMDVGGPMTIVHPTREKPPQESPPQPLEE